MPFLALSSSAAIYKRRRGKREVKTEMTVLGREGKKSDCSPRRRSDYGGSFFSIYNSSAVAHKPG